MSFDAIETKLNGALVLQPKVIGDERGFSCETLPRSDFVKLGTEEGNGLGQRLSFRLRDRTRHGLPDRTRRRKAGPCRARA